MIKRSRRTPFGRVLAEIRFKEDERMVDMAKSIGVSTSFLSALELGRKQVSKDLIGKLFSAYDIDESKKDEIRELAAMSGTSIRLNLEGASDQKREFVSNLSKKLAELDDDVIAQLQEVLQ